MIHCPRTTRSPVTVLLLLVGVFFTLLATVPQVGQALTAEEIEQLDRAAGVGDTLTPEQQAQVKEVREATKGGTKSYEISGCNWYSLSPGCLLANIADFVSDFFVQYIVRLAGGIFNYAMQYALTDIRETEFVSLGFRITLGIANMFFVLILLWIAIATIFDFEPYTARSLLLRLIVAALFINFSLAIGAAFINLGNGVARVFYDRCCPNGKAAEKFIQISKFQVIKDTTPEVGAGALLLKLEEPENIKETFRGSFTSSIWKLILGPVLIFVLFAGAIFVFLRQIHLAFLLVLGPLAFLFMILPTTRHFYTDWWERLVKWSFFLPAFTFFLFLSLETGANLLTVANRSPGADTGIPLFFQYIMVLSLLLGSLIAANQMSFHGGAAVVGWGKSMAKGTGGWAKRKGWKYAGMATGAAVAKVPGGRYLMRLPGIRQAMVGTTQKGRGIAKKEMEFYSKLGDSDLIPTLQGMRSGLAKQVLQSLPGKRYHSAKEENKIKYEGLYTKLGMSVPKKQTSEERFADLEGEIEGIKAEGTRGGTPS